MHWEKRCAVIDMFLLFGGGRMGHQWLCISDCMSVTCLSCFPWDIHNSSFCAVLKSHVLFSLLCSVPILCSFLLCVFIVCVHLQNQTILYFFSSSVLQILCPEFFPDKVNIISCPYLHLREMLTYSKHSRCWNNEYWTGRLFSYIFHCILHVNIIFVMECCVHI